MPRPGPARREINHWAIASLMQPQTKLARLGEPIVLAHGLFGFARIGVGRLTFTSYFRGIPEALTEAGNRVLVTRVPAIGSVDARAARLAEQILEAFPDEPVHLIGHSMGGLDARRLLADPSWRKRVLTLTTVGTPHLGSALADFAKLRVGRVYRLMAALGVEPRLPRRDPPRSPPFSPAAAGSWRPALLLRGRRPVCRDGELATAPDPCRSLRARGPQRWTRATRVGPRVRHAPSPLAAGPPQAVELAGSRRGYHRSSGTHRALQAARRSSRVARVRERIMPRDPRLRRYRRLEDRRTSSHPQDCQDQPAPGSGLAPSADLLTPPLATGPAIE